MEVKRDTVDLLGSARSARIRHHALETAAKKAVRAAQANGREYEQKLKDLLEGSVIIVTGHTETTDQLAAHGSSNRAACERLDKTPVIVRTVRVRLTAIGSEPPVVFGTKLTAESQNTEISFRLAALTHQTATTTISTTKRLARW